MQNSAPRGRLGCNHQSKGKKGERETGLFSELQRDSRMNFGGGFPVTQPKEFQFEGCWMPATPDKPHVLARSNSILENQQGSHLGLEKWAQTMPDYNFLVPIFDTSSQESRVPGQYPLGGMNVAERNLEVMNHIPSSYQQQPLPAEVPVEWNNTPLVQLLLQGDTDLISAHNTLSRDMRMTAERHLMPNLQPQRSNFRGDCSLGGLGSSSCSSFSALIANAHCQVGTSRFICPNSVNPPHQGLNPRLASEQRDNGNSSHQTLQYDFPTLSEINYDLNVSPTINTRHLTNAANLVHFTPVTPNKDLSIEKQSSATSTSARDESTNLAENLIQNSGDGAAEQHCDKHLHNILGSSSTITSTPLIEKKDSDKKSDLGIDLNETPQQKPPKRRKHRPKVIVEGKPKRTPKPAVPKNMEPKENRPAKRKYVRKNVPKDSTAQVVDNMRETTEPNTKAAQKSCKRVLIFDLEETGDENQSNAGAQEMQNRNTSTPNITLEHQATKLDGTNPAMGTVSSMQSGLPKRFEVENQLAGRTDTGMLNNQILNSYVPLLNRLAAVGPLASTENVQTSNSCAIGRHEMNRNAEQQQTVKEGEYSIRQQHAHATIIVQNGLQANPVKFNEMEVQKVKRLMQNMLQSVPKTPSKSCRPRGSKRDHSQTIECPHLTTTNHMASLLSEEASKLDESQRNGHNLHTRFPQNDKKKKIGEDYRDAQNMPYANRIALNSKPNFGAILNAHLESRRRAEGGNNEEVLFTGDQHVPSVVSGHHLLMQKIPSNPHSHTGRMRSTMVPNPVTPSLPIYSTGQGNGQILQTYNSMLEVTKKMGARLQKPASSRLLKLQENMPKRRGTKKKPMQPTTMDEITYRFQTLDLNGSGNGLQKHDQNALVLYKADGTLIPYEGDFIKKRKPRPKVDLDPETNRIWNLLMGKEGSEDLDQKGKDKEKWWEEERKVFRGRVDSFIARMHLVQGDRRFSRWKGSVVDSVIGVFLTQNVSDHLSSSAFMSMAARFPQKSSCNTQEENANINLEAPIAMLKPNDAVKWYEVPSEPSNRQNTIPCETVKHQDRSDNAGAKRSLREAQSQGFEEELILSQDSFDSSITQVAGGIRSCSGSNSETEDPSARRKPRNDQVSALTDYLRVEKSSWVQEVCSQENEGTVPNEKFKHGLTESPQLKLGSGTTNHLGYPSSNVPNNPDYLRLQPNWPSGGNDVLTDSRRSEMWWHETLSEESISSWQSPAYRSVKEPEAVSKSSGTEAAGSFGNFFRKQNGQWRPQERPITDPRALLRTDLMKQQGIPVPGPNMGNSRSSCISYQHKENNKFQLDCTSSIKPVKHAEALGKMHNTAMENVSNVNKLAEKTMVAGDCTSAANVQATRENKLVEPNLKDQIGSSNQSSNLANTKKIKVRKVNSESVKNNAVNWDNLRKQVEIDGTKKERRKDAMDSLDYEAVRNADVREISDAIKERGMNNMLAERMKEFLDRIVKDHGSIDLEWLRDVPPDKAKDYLLSIRGLGLKSVECVRLLTLHHLAFPVDTNVGRIAVRLGWVPLQPLPESLQLHLLELYPILESIQKYLWPRLCKLDQLTLYELHYQMITFGKVFCTKSKPNCNACPMRGECRHFASAFASARLALPGPEEKSIVSSTVPETSYNNPDIVIHPMALPAPQHDSIIEVGSKYGNCEPIIEEPATPEQECTEISQSDIEDSFYEDPDEIIPTIKLNMGELKENLQTYMQKNMELQEADMSKALVALTPDAASLPIPKLKNVSRLRTEHQVYELPDSHPLLERLERREPDDPSPYLLAIWTPGETANSIQPPEKSCGSEPDKLCSDTTCFSCNSVRESNSQIVRGTILIPCRTAMRGSFPLNGTYFQVNEVFADHESSLDPINVPREWIWNLPRRMVYFGTSVSAIFRGLSTEGIQYCFWKGFVCVRGFDLASRAPRPLRARLHFPASKLTRAKNDEKR